MKKYLPHAIGFIVALFLLTPPWDYHITCNVNSAVWLWCVVMAGFLAFLFMYTKTPIPIKLIVVWAFVGSFFSVAPYWSFQMTLPIVATAYFYAACKSVDNFEPILQAVQCAFFVICAFFIVQALGHDTLYNFNRPQPLVIGTTANTMVSSTLITCMAPFLLRYQKLNIVPIILIAIITHSAGMWFALAVGLFVYIMLRVRSWRICAGVVSALILVLLALNAPQHAVRCFPAGRGPVWKKTIKLILKRPIGYGPATYQLAFPALSRDLTMMGTTKEWTQENIKGTHIAAIQAHNDYLQWAFEMGWVGSLLLLWYIVYLFRLRRDPIALAGLTMLVSIMLVHFPTRLFCTVPIFVCYLAYFERSQEVLKHPHGCHRAHLSSETLM